MILRKERKRYSEFEKREHKDVGYIFFQIVFKNDEGERCDEGVMRSSSAIKVIVVGDNDTGIIYPLTYKLIFA